MTWSESGCVSLWRSAPALSADSSSGTAAGQGDGGVLMDLPPPWTARTGFLYAREVPVVQHKSWTPMSCKRSPRSPNALTASFRAAPWCWQRRCRAAATIPFSWQRRPEGRRAAAWRLSRPARRESGPSDGTRPFLGVYAWTTAGDALIARTQGRRGERFGHTPLSEP